MLIVVDTSVFVTLAKAEPGCDAFIEPMRLSRVREMSAGNYLECAMIAESRLGSRSSLDAWLLDEEIAVVPVDLALARLASDAFSRFGKGRHPAGLNYGDCFAYALAWARRAPLLFKGDDFARTDIVPALTLR